MKFHHEIEFMQVAKQVSKNSKDPSRKIGAVAVSNDGSRRILSSGWNGFPRKIQDKPERLNNRELKYKYIIHAEMNCIYNACYNGTSLYNSIFFVYGLPVCSNCAIALTQVGISSVICQIIDLDNDNTKPWIDSWNLSKSIFDEAGIKHTIWNNEFSTIEI